MSGVKKGAKKAGKWIGKNWKSIALVAGVTFAAGLSTVGSAGWSGAFQAAGGGLKGALAATGSTLYAGATSIAGSFGLGSGAKGTAAAYGVAAGHGTTLGTGAAARALGFGGAGVSPQAAGAAQQVLEAGQGSKAAMQAAQGANVAEVGRTLGGQTTAQSAVLRAQGVDPSSTEYQEAAMFDALTGGSRQGGLLQAIAPTALQMGGAYFMSRADEEANQPRALFGVDFKTGQNFQPNMPQQPQAPQRPQAPPGGAPPYAPPWAQQPSVVPPIYQGG